MHLPKKDWAFALLLALNKFFRRHPGILFKQMAKILWVIAAAHLFRHAVNFLVASVQQKLFRFIDPQLIQVCGKPLPYLQHKLPADIIYIHIKMVFGNPFGIGKLIIGEP